MLSFANKQQVELRLLGMSCRFLIAIPNTGQNENVETAASSSVISGWVMLPI